jgi:hypothetical protein
VARHSGQRYPQSPATAVEERLHVPEGRVAALAGAVRVLAHGVEDLPTSEAGQGPAAKAARRAYNLLLVAELRPPDTQQAAGHPDT